MARSTYVYVVVVLDTPIAAFTVKHELLSWLNRHPLKDARVWRVHDNTHGEPITDISEDVLPWQHRC